MRGRSHHLKERGGPPEWLKSLAGPVGRILLVVIFLNLPYFTKGFKSVAVITSVLPIIVFIVLYFSVAQLIAKAMSIQQNEAFAKTAVQN